MIEPIKPLIDAQTDWTFRRGGKPPLHNIEILLAHWVAIQKAEKSAGWKATRWACFFLRLFPDRLSIITRKK